MKILLKRDWDLSMGAPVGEEIVEGHFVRRETELNLLINEILRKNRGAILVSGYPGVGKTSLVYKALSEAKKKDEKKGENTIIVLFNAPQLEFESENANIDPLTVIKNLIRRLYSATQDMKNLNSELKKQIETLYRKAVATEFNLVTAYHISKEESKEIIKERTTLLSVNNLIYLSFWIIAAIFQFVDITRWKTFNKIIPLLFAIPIPIIINIIRKKYFKQREFEATKEEAKELYKLDNSVGNLEFDLDKIHTKMSKNGIKFIYVIDELDKINNDQATKILKFFKNLFTLSDALFIILAGEKMYNIGEGTEEHSYRKKEYTYFTSKYYLSRPMWRDMSSYFDAIIHDKQIEKDELEILKRALWYEAENDFFNLKNVVKDRITNFAENNLPVIEMENLNDDDLQRARLQKAITVLFEEKYRSSRHSKWKENENLLRNIIEHAGRIYSYYPGMEFGDPEDAYSADFGHLIRRNLAGCSD
jgi:Cdc6-like AAA superfamily ATPase